MSPTDAVFLLAESREHPMHVGGLQLFQPPEGMDALDVRTMLDEAMIGEEVAPLFRKRARRSITSLGQWGWEQDQEFDLEHHVRRNALPQPGRVLELLALCSRLHSSLLDRHRPLWEMHLIEGLNDGRYAIYSKTHHALVDGVSALRMLSRMLSDDPDERGMPAPWAPRAHESVKRSSGRPASSPLKAALDAVGEVTGLVPALYRTLSRSVSDQSGAMSLSAPKTMLNVPITGARRFAAQSWPIERIRQVGKAADATVNDVVLAMCSGALRAYLQSMDALPDAPLIAMVPVSLHSDDAASDDGGGNAVGVVMCNLGTHLDDAARRLETVHASMVEGKESMRGMSPTQIMMMSAIGMSPLMVLPLLRLNGIVRPPFNLVISNVPGPRKPMYWNGARLDGLYPLSIPLDGQALNITCTSYSDEIAFGLTGCRRSVPHLQRLLGDLDAELAALEEATGVA
ncbi:MAG TPA: wax ester/triacylglycerol synthase family O-acyltransferase [Jatrophihabitantaceae bacterium]|jgi:diacylglycerol O-acyltransferase|nr:wax ester/triacylglycerol synthase family O-acyltransferase [Jatrophihabitantaceae bacterium]